MSARAWGRDGRTRRDGCALGALALATAALLVPTSHAGACEPLGTGERVAQTVMTRVPGTSLGEKNRDLVKRRAGSVLISNFNITGEAQIERFTKALRERAPLDLLAAVNEETLEDKGLVTELSARELARKRGSDFARHQGREVGEAMHDLGLDWNLSPVLDVARADSYVGGAVWPATAPPTPRG